jgi:hypothetical protein
MPIHSLVPQYGLALIRRPEPTSYYAFHRDKDGARARCVDDALKAYGFAPFRS